jgi:hypothetical protein
MAAGQFLVNERFSRSSDPNSAVSGTRAFFLFPRPRWLRLDPQAPGGVVTIRLQPVRVVEINRSGFIGSMTGAVIEEAPAITAMTQGGLVFKRFDGIVLDAGWGRGEVAFQKFPGRGVDLHGPRGAHVQCAEPGRLQLRGPATPGPGARQRCRARPLPQGTLRPGVRRRAAPQRPTAGRRVGVRAAADPRPAATEEARATPLGQARAGRNARPGSADVR